MVLINLKDIYIWICQGKSHKYLLVPIKKRQIENLIKSSFTSEQMRLP